MMDAAVKAELDLLHRQLAQLRREMPHQFVGHILEREYVAGANITITDSATTGDRTIAAVAGAGGGGEGSLVGPHILLDGEVHIDTVGAGHAPVAGDIVYALGTTPVWDGLGIGSTGAVLTVVSGLPAWTLPADNPNGAIGSSGDTGSGSYQTHYKGDNTVTVTLCASDCSLKNMRFFYRSHVSPWTSAPQAMFDDVNNEVQQGTLLVGAVNDIILGPGGLAWGRLYIDTADGNKLKLELNSAAAAAEFYLYVKWDFFGAVTAAEAAFTHTGDGH